MNYDERLWQIIHTRIGATWTDHYHVIDNRGPNAGDGGGYLVHLKGGVFFEIMKDDDGYYFDSHWTGPMEIDTAGKAIGYLAMLGVNFD